MRSQRGFTLIELVVVIIVLGILSAVALPRFMNTAGDARSAVMKAVEGALRGANNMLYAKAAANGLESAALAILELPSGEEIRLKFGYASNLFQLIRALELTPITDFVVPAADNIADPAMVIQHAKANLPAGCQITYTAPTAAGLSPTYISTYTSALNGC